jgi:SAM-dependent methyltransferase
MAFDRYLSRSGGLTILDLGCGAGRLAIPLARQGHRIVGLDLSRQMLREAARLSQGKGLGVEVLAADARAIPLKSRSVACVICMHSSFGVFTRLPERRAVIRETWRVLEEGGLFVLNVHNALSPGSWGRRWAKWAMILAHKWLVGERGEWGNRVVNEYGYPVHCHFFTLGELERLLKGHFDVVDVLGYKGFWEDNRLYRYFPNLLAEDWIIVGRKHCRQPVPAGQAPRHSSPHPLLWRGR